MDSLSSRIYLAKLAKAVQINPALGLESCSVAYWTAEFQGFCSLLMVPRSGCGPHCLPCLAPSPGSVAGPELAALGLSNSKVLTWSKITGSSPSSLLELGSRLFMPAAWCWMLLKYRTKNILYLMFRYKKKKLCYCRTIHIKCKAQLLALWVASYFLWMLNSSISMFCIWERRDSNVFGTYVSLPWLQWREMLGCGKRQIRQWRKAHLCLKTLHFLLFIYFWVTCPCGTITLHSLLGSMTSGSDDLQPVGAWCLLQHLMLFYNLLKCSWKDPGGQLSFLYPSIFFSVPLRTSYLKYTLR